MNNEVMIPVSEKYRYRRLKEKNVVIEDRFIRKSDNRKEIYIRSTDGLRNDQILNLLRLEKLYYINNKCIGKIKGSENIRYTFYSNIIDEDIKCPNCGYESNSKEFFNGCPYCKTEFNINYTTQNYGYKKVKEVIKAKKIYMFIFIVAIIIDLLVLKQNNFTLYSLIANIIGFPIIYIAVYLSVILLMIPIIIIRILLVGEELSIWRDAQKFNLNINEFKFYSDLNCELLKYFYDEKLMPEEKNLIDFQILKYDDIKVISNTTDLILEVKYTIQKVYLKSKKIIDIIEKQKAVLKYNNIQNNLNGYKIIECKNCGNSLDVTKNECEFCGGITNFKNEWSIIKINNKNI